MITIKDIFTAVLLLLFAPSLTSQNQFGDKKTIIPGIENHSKDQYLTDSTYFYDGVQSGSQWYNNRIYRVAQRNEIGNVLQAYDYDHDSLTGDWYMQRKYEGSFLNDTIRKVWLSWVKNTANNAWILSDSIHFNIHGEPTISWYKTWDPFSHKFVGGKLSDFFYNESGILHLTYNHYYDTIDQSWERDNYEVVLYNQNNLDSLRQIFYWNGLAWIKDRQITNSYTPKLFLAEEIQETWDGVEWVNERKWEHVYSDDLVDKIYEYAWQPALGEWMYNRYSDYEYNPDETTYRITEYFWDGSDWLNTTRKTYLYDANQSPLEILNEFWSFGSEVWRNVSLNTYTYHAASGNRKEFTFYTWDIELERWKNYYRERNFWGFYPSPSVPELSQKDFEIFPNPSNGIFNIRFEDDHQLSKGMLLMIYSAEGKAVKTIPVNTNSLNVNVSDLSNGIYRLILKTGYGFLEHPIIISK